MVNKDDSVRNNLILMGLSRFNIPTLQDSFTSTQTQTIISQLHAILKPFLLRRIKADVECNLPPKKEYVLYAPLTEKQKSVYEAVFNGGLRQFLINARQQAHDYQEEQEEQEEQQVPGKRKLRKRTQQVNYNVEDDNDDEYFNKIATGELQDPRKKHIDQTYELGKDHIRRAAGQDCFIGGSILLKFITR